MLQTWARAPPSDRISNMTWIQFCDAVSKLDFAIIDDQDDNVIVTGFLWRCADNGCHESVYHLVAIRPEDERNPQVLGILYEELKDLVRRRRDDCGH